MRVLIQGLVFILACGVSGWVIGGLLDEWLEWWLGGEDGAEDE